MRLEEALKIIQKISTERYAPLIEKIRNNKEDCKEQILSYIEKIIKDNEILVSGYEDNTEELAKFIYNEMEGFSILDEFFSNKEIEEINILSWRDIVISYNNGETKRSDKYFFSVQHEKDVLDRLLDKHGMKINKSQLSQVGYITYNDINIRITVIGDELYDQKFGYTASIRIVNPKKMKKEDFIDFGLCNDEMLNFLSLAYSYGISICVIGQTGSGKTTLMSYIMSQIPDNKRLITMEEKTREYDLHKYDEKGFMINNVMHLITKEGKDGNNSVSLSDLLKLSLTFDPDYLCVSEMKGDESFEAVESANTGHAVISTTHANTCEEAYHRILTLSKKSLDNDINTEILMKMICNAFPIVVNIHKYKDNVRRICEITECIEYDKDNNVKLKTLYKYDVDHTEEIEKDKKYIVYGHFEKKNKPSNKLKEVFYNSGATREIISKYFEEDRR